MMKFVRFGTFLVHYVPPILFSGAIKFIIFTRFKILHSVQRQWP